MNSDVKIDSVEGTVLVRNKRIPATFRVISNKATGTTYSNVVRGTFTGRTVTCSRKIANTFLADMPEPQAPEYEDLKPNLKAITDRAVLASRFNRLLGRVHYRNPKYDFIIGITPGMKYPYVQLRHYRPDSNTGKPEWGGGGKAYLSEFMSDSEFFQLLLGLAIAYEQHEVREFFKVDGKRVFGPHINTDALATIADQLDARQQIDLKR